MTGLPKTNCLAAAIATPLTPALSPDIPRLLAHAKWLMTRGCDGITLFGTTGEGPEFSVADRMATLEGMITGGIEPARLIVSITALAIPDVVELANHAIDRGVHGLLLMPPCVFRGGITEDGTYRFYAAVIDRIARSELRLYLYHFPDISGVPITPQVIRRLDERYSGIIAGVKDSGGDIDFTAGLVRRFSHLSIFTGSEIHLPELLGTGLRGTVCGLSNIMPRLMRAMMDLPTAFDRRKALPFLLSGDAILSRRPFIASAKTVIAENLFDPAWRRVVPPMAELPMVERQRVVADFGRWEAGLPDGWRSLAETSPTAGNVIDLRRA
ncbi:MAG: dihydrodipicolinate synthase family protein [Devosia sp.]|nr:dihydrodipicolinate synthase family protein [Devosia sp.]